MKRLDAAIVDSNMRPRFRKIEPIASTKMLRETRGNHHGSCRKHQAAYVWQINSGTICSANKRTDLGALTDELGTTSQVLALNYSSILPWIAA